MDKYSKFFFGIVSLSLLIIAFSLFYYLFFRPYQKESNFKSCLLKTEEDYVNKERGLSEEITKAEQGKKEIEPGIWKLVDEYDKDVPYPEYPKGVTSYGLLSDVSQKQWKWKSDRVSILDPLKPFDVAILERKKDLENIKKEKKDQEDICYRRYR